MFRTLDRKYKKPLLFSLVAASFVIPYAYAKQQQRQQSIRCLWNTIDHYGFKDTKQKHALLFLMQQSGIKNSDDFLHHKLQTDEDLLKKLKEFVELTQQHFTIRSGTEERWNVQTTDWMKDSKNQVAILAALKTLGMTDAVVPQLAHSDAIGILGATAPTMKIRIKYAEQLREANLFPSARHLILIAGERYVILNKEGLSPDGSRTALEILAKKLGKPSFNQLTETDLITELYGNAAFPGLDLIVIDTPKGNLPRPTTETTIAQLCQWLRAHPEVEGITFVSNQPHVKYQRAIIEEVLVHQNLTNLKFEVIGPACNPFSLRDPSAQISSLVGTLGSQIYATTPSVLRKLELKATSVEQRQQLMDLYKKQPFIYKNIQDYLTTSDFQALPPNRKKL